MLNFSRSFLAVTKMAVVVCAIFAVAGCGDDQSTDRNSDESGAAESTRTQAETDALSEPVVRGVEPKVERPKLEAPKQLYVKDLRRGNGKVVSAGDEITVQFVGLRWDGEQFQSSWDNGRYDPFTFKLHSTPPQVIPGWEKGIPGMRVGGRRELIVPPKLIYHPGRFPDFPLGVDDTLVYVVELLGAKGSPS